MKFVDIMSMATDGVKDRKFRFALNIIGILIGGAAITSLLSITEGMNQDVNRQLGQLGPTIISVSAGGFFGIGGGTQLTNHDLEKIDKISHVAIATPIVSMVASVKVGGRSDLVQVIGIDPNEYMRVVKNIEVEEGRFLSRSDTASAVIGSNIVKPSGEEKPIVKVGDRIVIEVSGSEGLQTGTFRVVGTLSQVGAGMVSSPDDSIFIPIRSAQQLFDMSNRLSRITVEADSVDTVDEVESAIKAKLGEDITVISSSFLRETTGRILGTISAVLGGVAAISLVVAGIGIINTMTISVMERTREIGILKAIGSKSRDVLLMFLSEALITGVIGGVCGVLIGITLSQVVSSLAEFSIGIATTPVTSLSIMVGVVTFSTVTGAISGLYPAWRAAKLKPVEALRYE